MLPTLKHKEYFRASKLGSGSFGSVITVYDEDGGEFAAKVFDQAEEEENDENDEDEDWEDNGGSSGMDVGALREMSILRLLNGAHPNIMWMVDVSHIEDQARAAAAPQQRRSSGSPAHSVPRRAVLHDHAQSGGRPQGRDRGQGPHGQR